MPSVSYFTLPFAARPISSKQREMPITLDVTCPAGSEVREHNWLVNATDKSPFDVAAVSWEMFCDDKSDITDILWSGKLLWRFSDAGLDQPIGMLSMFYGNVGSLVEKTSMKSNLEQLAEVRTQAEWLNFLQSFLLGQGYLYRGLAGYHKPVVLRSNCSLVLTFNPPFTPAGRVRFRVNLHGTELSVIEIG